MNLECTRIYQIHFETIYRGIFAHDKFTIDGIEYNTTDKYKFLN